MTAGRAVCGSLLPNAYAAVPISCCWIWHKGQPVVMFFHQDDLSSRGAATTVQLTLMHPIRRHNVCSEGHGGLQEGSDW